MSSVAYYIVEGQILYSKTLLFDDRKAKANILPNDWIKSKKYFQGFSDGEIVLFRLSHDMNLHEAIKGVFDNVDQYRNMNNLSSDRSDFWDISNIHNITGNDIHQLILVITVE